MVFSLLFGYLGGHECFLDRSEQTQSALDGVHRSNHFLFLTLEAFVSENKYPLYTKKSLLLITVVPNFEGKFQITPIQIDKFSEAIP